MSLFRQDPLTATLLQGMTQALARTEANDKRQDHHEDECGERYKEITRVLEKVSDAIKAQGDTLNDKLDQQTTNLNAKLYTIGGTIIAGLVYALYEILHQKVVL